MIKYFVNTRIATGQGGADLVRAQVRNWTNGLSAAWGNFSKYTCKCAGSQTTYSAFCCSDLDNLTVALTATPDISISTSGILHNIENLATEFYEKSLFDQTPWVYGLSAQDEMNYNWGALQDTQEIVQAARFDTTKPSYSYTQQEAMSPPSSTEANGLWDTCHGAVRQILFTLPVGENGQLVPAPPLFQG